MIEKEMANEIAGKNTPVVKKKRFLDRYNEMPKSLQKGKYLFIFLALLIPFVHFIIFYVILNASSFLLAFETITYVNGKEIISYSFDNFKAVIDALKNGSSMTNALRNTLQLFTVDFLMIIPIYLFAYCFSKNMPGSGFFRVIMYLPSIISAIAFCTMVKGVLQQNVGLLAVVFKSLGGELPPLLNSEENAWPTVLGYCAWAGVYANLLLFEGAIRKIPSENLDAAGIDGANAFQELIYIILPMTWGTLAVIIYGKAAGFLSITGPILTLTGGAYNTQTLNFWFYEQVTLFGNYSMSAAASMILSLIQCPIGILVLKLVNKISERLEG